MELLPAVLTVAGSYAGWILAYRRVRVARGRRAGPEPAALARYDHVALAAELAKAISEMGAATPAAKGRAGAIGAAEGAFAAAADTATARCDAGGVVARGARIVPLPTGPIGVLPAPWADAPWAFAAPTRLAAARDDLLRGDAASAARAAQAEGAPRAAIRSLFTWAFLHHLFGGALGIAADVAEALGDAEPRAARLVHRLLARLAAVRAELAPPGQEREAACAAASRHWRRAGGVAQAAGAAEAGLGAHLEVMRLSFWDLEWREFAARRQLRRAFARFPQAPILHLVRAHLASQLGDGEGATDHLARALYYARGDRFYARPIVSSPWVARMRPWLAAEARGVLSAGSESPPIPQAGEGARD